MAKAPMIDTLPGKSPAVSISNGYAVREQLKARGYKFDGKTACWVRAFEQPKDGMAEIVWAADAGFDVHPRLNIAKCRAAAAA